VPNLLDICPPHNANSSSSNPVGDVQPYR
jgi:hypothetical protein